MPLTSPAGCRNHEADWLDLFHRRRGAEIAALATPEVLEELRADVHGHCSRSLALRHLLNYLRMTPVEGRTFVYAAENFRTYKIGTLRQQRGVPPEIDNTQSWPTEDEAIFAAVVTRLRTLGAPAAMEVTL